MNEKDKIASIYNNTQPDHYRVSAEVWDHESFCTMPMACEWEYRAGRWNLVIKKFNDTFTF